MATLSRRSFLRGTAGALAAIPASTLLWQQPALAGTAAPSQLHVQFGADSARQAAVSWATDGSVRNPRLRLGLAHRDFGHTVPADTRTYVDGLNNVETYTHHVRLDALLPDTDYVYEVTHDGTSPITGTFRTAPQGRFPFRFTSFGDLGTGDPSWSKSALNGVTAVHQVEYFDPMFHLLNGDLAYANNNQTQQPQCWGAYMDNMMYSARNRPWMPALGNHEVEAGGGPLGEVSYLTRFALPDNQTRDHQGHWYTFRTGSVQVISLDANDVILEDDASQDPTTGQSVYITGYSGGAQVRWLEHTLAAARADRGVDWIVVIMHQFAISSSATGHGGDLGIREAFMPLFDRYGVDFVLCGHDHDYERSHPVRGTDTSLLRPRVVDDSLTTVDTSRGTVHLILGGGGTASLDDTYLTDPDAPGTPMAFVRTKRLPFKADPDASEIATWSAVRDPDAAHPYGIAVFDVDPGTVPGGRTSITVRYFHTPTATVSNPFPTPVLYDQFTAYRNRSDGWR